MYWFLALFFVGLSFNIEAMEENHMAVIEKPSFRLMGIECKTRNHPDAAPQDIPELWNRFFSENVLGQIPEKTSDEVVCLYCEYEGDFTMPYTCVIGCPTGAHEAPPGLVVKTIPQAAYAVFKAEGELPQSIIDAWGRIWTTDLDRTYTGDFEVYPDFNGSNDVKIFIAVKKGNKESITK